MASSGTTATRSWSTPSRTTSTRPRGAPTVGLQSALTRTINAYSTKNNLRRISRTPASARGHPRGLTAVISVRSRGRSSKDRPRPSSATPRSRASSSHSQRPAGQLPRGDAGHGAEDHPEGRRCGEGSRAPRKRRELVRRKGALDNSSLPASCRLPGERFPRSATVHVEGESPVFAKQGGIGDSRRSCPSRQDPHVEKARFDKMLAATRSRR